MEILGPERIGAFTQRTVPHVGLVSSGASLEAIDNGVNQQTLVVQVGNEVPRTISINKGDDARTISDKINQAGAQVNSTAVTTSNVYIDGYGSFSFKISSSSAPDIEDVITVGATAGSQAASLAAEVNQATLSIIFLPPSRWTMTALSMSRWSRTMDTTSRSRTT